MTNHIAEVYFRAWKKATGDFVEKMESVCVQDLMQSAILLHRTSPVHGNVRQVGQGGVRGGRGGLVGRTAVWAQSPMASVYL